MTSPFIPAEWGEEYDLAGAVWKPEDDNTDNYGMIALQTHMYRLARLGDNHMEGDPLLPSPAWINEQRNPRAVAIAALERAGFRKAGKERTIWHVLELEGLITIFFLSVNLSGGDDLLRPRFVLSMEEAEDPAMARYAVDCFTVLHEWANEVNWDTEEAQDD